MTKSVIGACVLAGMSLLLVNCGGSSPTSPSRVVAPSPVPTPIVLQYAINIPFEVTVQDLRRQFPNGRQMSPIAAQHQYDYTSTYGAPNVYVGPVAVRGGAYAGTGIVIAPESVANEDSFHGSEWPTLGAAADAVITWHGDFVFVPAQPH